MKKFIAILIAACILVLPSCSERKSFTKADGQKVTAVPYGLFTEEDKIPGVVYEINTADVVLSIIFCETIVAPLVIIGTDMYEPVEYNEVN